jgi:hypothetical protein
MKDLEEQRVCVNFSFKFGKPFTETSEMLQQERIFEPYANVTRGISVSNRAERPSKTTQNVDGLPLQLTTITLLAVIRQNHRLTLSEVAEEVGTCKFRAT